MKVFISWSGERSQALAHALHRWLPLVLHYVEPWLSEADVAAGDRWAQEVAVQLEASNFGIICVTPENVGAPWVLFEAGALAKSMKGSRVVPLLYNLEFSDITGPLAQFQAKKVERSGVGEVILSINHAAEHAIPDERAKQLFGALWPEFEKMLESIPEEAPTEKHMRPQHEILEELVAGVRGLDGRFRELEAAVTDPRRRLRRHRMFHPMMIDELTHMISPEGEDPVGLLVLAGAVREDLPWLAEVIVETYREMKGAEPKDAQRAFDRLRRVMKVTGRGPMAEFATSEESHMMLRELPMMLDHFMHRIDPRRERSSSESEGEEEREV